MSRDQAMRIDFAKNMGRSRAEKMGVGLTIEVRRSIEYQRRDKRGAFVWTDENGKKNVLAAVLKNARFIFEVVSAGIVLAAFDRRYEADAYLAGFTERRVKSIRGNVETLLSTRWKKQCFTRAMAA